MIYSNRKLETERDGKIVVARDSKGQPLLTIKAEEGVTGLEWCRSLKGYNLRFREGELVMAPVDRKDDERIFLVLSAEQEQNTEGNGHIMVPKSFRSRVLSLVEGASDLYASETWEVVVVEVNRMGDIFRVVPSGFRGANISATFYFVWKEKIYGIDQPQIESFYAEQGTRPPYGLFRKTERGRIVATKQGWIPCPGPNKK